MEGITNGIQRKEILIGALGIDVFLEDKTNAIMIRASDNGEEWHERCFPYEFVNGKVTIEKHEGFY